MALNIGANDVANNMGPAVGANALTMGGAIVIAAVFESAGALLAGGDVVSTIARGIIAPESAALAPRSFVWAMMAALLSSALWVNLATWIGARLDHAFGRGRRDGIGHRRGGVRRGELADDGRYRGQLGHLAAPGRARSRRPSCGSSRRGSSTATTRSPRRGSGCRC
jgi:hypothetical protein